MQARCRTGQFHTHQSRFLWNHTHKGFDRMETVNGNQRRIEPNGKAKDTIQATLTLGHENTLHEHTNML